MSSADTCYDAGARKRSLSDDHQSWRGPSGEGSISRTKPSADSRVRQFYREPLPPDTGKYSPELGLWVCLSHAIWSADADEAPNPSRRPEELSIFVRESHRASRAGRVTPRLQCGDEENSESHRIFAAEAQI